MNDCIFSPDRRYRYSLVHRWDELVPERRIVWIGLNPSTADEDALDPTLRRIKNFSTAFGFNCFEMTNLFAFRATQPEDMMNESDPIGEANDETLRNAAARSTTIVAAWGALGWFRQRGQQVIEQVLGERMVWCLEQTKQGLPRHPLYIKGDAILKRYYDAGVKPMPF